MEENTTLMARKKRKIWHKIKNESKQFRCYRIFWYWSIRIALKITSVSRAERQKILSSNRNYRKKDAAYLHSTIFWLLNFHSYTCTDKTLNLFTCLIAVHKVYVQLCHRLMATCNLAVFAAWRDAKSIQISPRQTINLDSADCWSSTVLIRPCLVTLEWEYLLRNITIRSRIEILFFGFSASLAIKIKWIHWECTLLINFENIYIVLYNSIYLSLFPQTHFLSSFWQNFFANVDWKLTFENYLNDILSENNSIGWWVDEKRDRNKTNSIIRYLPRILMFDSFLIMG